MRRRAGSGFTLVELMISVALLAVISPALLYFVTAMQGGFDNAGRLGNRQAATANAIDVLRGAVRKAGSGFSQCTWGTTGAATQRFLKKWNNTTNAWSELNGLTVLDNTAGPDCFIVRYFDEPEDALDARLKETLGLTAAAADADVDNVTTFAVGDNAMIWGVNTGTSGYCSWRYLAAKSTPTAGTEGYLSFTTGASGDTYSLNFDPASMTTTSTTSTTDYAHSATTTSNFPSAGFKSSTTTVSAGVTTWNDDGDRVGRLGSYHVQRYHVDTATGQLILDTRFLKCVESNTAFETNPALCDTRCDANTVTGNDNEEEVIAEDVEDLQLASACDADGSGTICEFGETYNGCAPASYAADEWVGNDASDTASQCRRRERAVRITLLLREKHETGYPGLRPKIENHAAATTGDGYRRYSLRAIERTMNLSP